ncbi:MAG: hypothetical protein J7M17_04725 [Anaerolineae bacterium]|nr:hypothetical protein [Anaerolineae bacterium]
MRDLEKYSTALTKAFKDILVPVIEAHEDQMVEVLKRDIFDQDGPRSIDYEPTTEILLYRSVQWGMFEIYASFESLLDAELYIRRFPYGNTRITKVRHLRYVVENHLNEVYILKERLKAYLNTVQELYAKGSRKKEVRKITQSLFQFNSEAFGDIVAVRGSHVHSLRYDDEELRRLGNMERLSHLDSDASWSQHLAHSFDFEYKRIRTRRAEQIKAINEAVERVLDIFFSRLYPVLFDEDENLIHPDCGQ